MVRCSLLLLRSQLASQGFKTIITVRYSQISQNGVGHISRRVVVYSMRPSVSEVSPAHGSSANTSNSPNHVQV